MVFTPPSTRVLTPSQSAVLATCLAVFPNFKVVVIKGESEAGKYVVAQELFTQVNAAVVYFDLSYMDPLPLTNASIGRYLNGLHEDVQREMYEKKQPYGCIYIRNYNRVADVLMDANDPHRHLWLLTLKGFLETMNSRVRIVITTQGCLLPESLHWCCTLSTTRADMEQVLAAYVQENIITAALAEVVRSNARIIPVGRMLYCLKYAVSVQDDMGYEKALAKFAGPLATTVAKPPQTDVDLIGVQDLMGHITTAIITPIKLGSRIPLKPGVVICGPPGTGKTSLGKWLAHQLPGKFYPVTGTDAIFDLQRTIEEAREHAPAVVFLDDCDALFASETYCRVLCCCLDGLEGRQPLSFVITCMHLKSIPSALLRGGRLELTLITRLPTPEHIQALLTARLQHSLTVLPAAAPQLQAALTPDFLTALTRSMAGWNYADVKRVTDDVLRMLADCSPVPVSTMFQGCIGAVRQQYELSSKTPTTNLDDTTTNSYIS